MLFAAAAGLLMLLVFPSQHCHQGGHGSPPRTLHKLTAGVCVCVTHTVSQLLLLLAVDPVVASVSSDGCHQKQQQQ